MASPLSVLMLAVVTLVHVSADPVPADVSNDWKHIVATHKNGLPYNPLGSPKFVAPRPTDQHAIALMCSFIQETPWLPNVTQTDKTEMPNWARLYDIRSGDVTECCQKEGNDRELCVETLRQKTVDQYCFFWENSPEKTTLGINDPCCEVTGEARVMCVDQARYGFDVDIHDRDRTIENMQIPLIENLKQMIMMSNRPPTHDSRFCTWAKQQTSLDASSEEATLLIMDPMQKTSEVTRELISCCYISGDDSAMDQCLSDVRHRSLDKWCMHENILKTGLPLLSPSVLKEIPLGLKAVLEYMKDIPAHPCCQRSHTNRYDCFHAELCHPPSTAPYGHTAEIAKYWEKIQQLETEAAMKVNAYKEIHDTYWMGGEVASEIDIGPLSPEELRKASPLNIFEEFTMQQSKTYSNEEAQGTFNWASYYGDHMVLQQGPHRAVIWGYGEVGATVSVTVSVSSATGGFFSTNVYEGYGGRGVWKVTLPPMEAGGPHQLKGVHDNHGKLQWLLLKDVMFGDVWVCSGQSNMEFAVKQVFNATEAIAEAANYSNIRLFTADLVQSDKPLYDLEKVLQPWIVASPESVGGPVWKYFSAVCWFFGTNLYNHLYSPAIGLVATSWGGTPIEAWSSPEVLEKCGITQSDRAMSEDWQNGDPEVSGPSRHSVLWNAMIHPFLSMTIKGAIWYQGTRNTGLQAVGEANTGHPDTYNCTFPGMIDSWREEWYKGKDKQTHRNFPFGFVQLSTSGRPGETNMGYPAIRWHQTADYGYVPNEAMPNVFMAVAVDLGDESSPYGSVHPRDKQDVASRLVLGARAVAYGQTDVTYKGPIPVSVAVDYEMKQFVRVLYDRDITVKSKDGFEVCCSPDLDKCSMTSSEWVAVPIFSSTSNSITLQLQQNCWKDVTYIRYLWELWPCDFKQCAVYSVENNLPQPPFFGCMLEPDKKPPC